MGMTRKWGVLAIGLLVVFSLLIGCSDNQKGASDQPDASGEPTADQQSPSDSGSVYKDKYDPAVTISTVWGVDPALTFKNGETIDKNVATRWAHDELGIDIQSLWYVTDANGAFTAKMRLALSSGSEMPDVVTIGDELLAQDLIDSGIYGEVGSLFDQYANDNWKKAMSLDPNVWNPYIRDGKRMGIPVLDYAYNHDYLLWIRQDWMDQLHLSAPKTLDELEHMMDLFKNQNPDGLAPDDVVPLSIGFKTSMNTWMGDPSWIFGAYGTIPQQWNKTSSGELEYGSINEAMKPGLIKIKEWREKGYIPREAALWDENKTSEPAVAGTAGIIPGPYWMSGWPLQDTKKNVETAVWKPYPIPAGPDGKAARHGTLFTNGVVLINKNMKHPEALFTYENYLFDHLADPPADDPWTNGVFKGYDYDVVDGQNVYGDAIPGGAVNISRYWLVRDGARIPDAQMDALQRLANGAEAKTKLELEVKNNYGPETPAASTVLMQQKDISMTNMFTGSSTPTMKTKLDYLNKIEMQTLNEVIYGNKGPEAFDQFVQTWKSSGGDQITKEVNDWYNSVK